MAKFISSCCFFLLTFSTALLCSEEALTSPEPQKTILILSSKGGGGHNAAVSTLQKLIGDQYNLKIIYPIDQLRIWGVPACEQFYNMMLRKEWVRSMNFIVRHLAPHLFRSRMNKLEKIIKSYADAYHPDLVISLIPFVNYPASEVARKRDLPFLIITTDNDLRNWVFQMDKIKHPEFKVTIGADLPTTRSVLLSQNIPDHCIETTGLPLRPEFLSRKDKEKIKEEFQLPLHKDVVLIMMGGAGGSTCYQYAKKIGRMDLGVHLIAIVGRNAKLKQNLETLKLHPSNSMTVFGYTDRISDIMAVSDVLITKPGPGTINEALAMKLPILIDNTGISLFWERANVDMVTKYGVGQKVKEYNQVKGLLTTFLKDSSAKEKIDNSFVSVPPNSFHIRIQEIIKQMLYPNASNIAESETFVLEELPLKFGAKVE